MTQLYQWLRAHTTAFRSVIHTVSSSLENEKNVQRTVRTEVTTQESRQVLMVSGQMSSDGPDVCPLCGQPLKQHPGPRAVSASESLQDGQLRCALSGTTPRLQEGTSKKPSQRATAIPSEIATKIATEIPNAIEEQP